MTSFQRMIAIPQEEYLQMSTLQNIRQPLSQKLYQLEKDYNDLGKVDDPYKRLMLQSETLNDMKEMKDQMRSYLTVSTPKPYRSRAQALFESIESFIKFNERGEIKDKDDQVIENSRLEDLIQHAVRDRRRNMTPKGWNEFLSTLREHNVPKSTLNKETLDEISKLSHVSIDKKDVTYERASRSRGRKKGSRGRSARRSVSRKRPIRKAKPSKRYPSSDFLKKF